MLTAIIVAAGSSRRLGFDKLTAPIAGKPVIEHSVAAFGAASSVQQIIVVARPDRVAEFEQLLGGMTKIDAIVPGGEHRHNSVQAGLERLSQQTTYVSVHDAARPLIAPAQIEQVFEQARIHGAASLAEPARDTLKRADQDLIVCEPIDRRNVYAMQTPQIFERRVLEEAYQVVARAGERVTDEVSAVELLGHKIMLVENPEVNFKITYERDLALAEAILLQRKQRA